MTIGSGYSVSDTLRQNSNYCHIMHMQNCMWILTVEPGLLHFDSNFLNIIFMIDLNSAPNAKLVLATQGVKLSVCYFYFVEHLFLSLTILLLVIL